MPDSIHIQRAAETLMHFAWQGLAIALLCWALMTLFRRPGVRYAIGCAGLLAMLVVPLATFFATRGARPPATVVAPAVTSLASPTLQINSMPPPSATFSVDASRRAWRERFEIAAVVMWSAGVSILVVRHAIGLAGIARLRRRATKIVNATLLDRFTRIAAALQVRRPIALLSTIDLDAPAVIGWLRPAILWPASLMTGLTPSQLDGLLAHELAHIRRHDYLVNLLQTLVETLGFYHPCVWWLSRRVRQEREHCCDDIAAAVVGDRMSYASTLVTLESARAAFAPPMVASTGGSLVKRVHRLLVPARPRAMPGTLPTVAMLCVGLAIGAWAYRSALAATTPPSTMPSIDEKQAADLAGRDLTLAGLLVRSDRIDCLIALAEQARQDPTDFAPMVEERAALQVQIRDRTAAVAPHPDDELLYPQHGSLTELWQHASDTATRLKQQLKTMAADAPDRATVEEKLARANGARRQHPFIGTYYMGGHVPRAGAYSLPPEGMTLEQAITSAGGLADDAKNKPDDVWISITVLSRTDRTKESHIYLRWGDRRDAEGRRLYLFAGDTIVVGAKPPQSARADAEYRFQVDDVVQYTISDLVGAGTVSTDQKRVSAAGKLSLPYLGAIEVKGKTEREVEAAIRNAYRDAQILPAAVVSVKVMERGVPADRDAQGGATDDREMKIAELNKEVAELRRQIQVLTERQAKTLVDTKLAADDAFFARLLAERDSFAINLARLSQTHGPDSAPVVKQREMLRTINTQIEQIAEQLNKGRVDARRLTEGIHPTTSPATAPVTMP